MDSLKILSLGRNMIKKVRAAVAGWRDPSVARGAQQKDSAAGMLYTCSWHRTQPPEFTAAWPGHGIMCLVALVTKHARLHLTTD